MSRPRTMTLIDGRSTVAPTPAVVMRWLGRACPIRVGALRCPAPETPDRPDAAAAAIRCALAEDGTWLVKEIRCDDTWAGNRRNPMLAMFLGFSIASCMSSALSEPDGAGLGTIGLPPRALEQLAHDAGFTRFQMHDFDDPANLYYEVRP